MTSAQPEGRRRDRAPLPAMLAACAVKNRCFLALSYDEVTPSPRNAHAGLAIARRLHPSAFGLPADGS